MATKWSELERINALRQTGALTEEEFNNYKAKLIADRPRPRRRGATLGLSLIVVALAVIGLMFVLLNRNEAAPAASNYPTAAAAAADASAAAAADAAKTTAPPDVSPDAVATAFALVYGNDATEVTPAGSLALTPRRIVVVKDNTAVLISEGVRDGGLNGGACHACNGTLRVDYVTWNGSGWVKTEAATRFSEPGNGWGAPPAWRVSLKGGLPALLIEKTYADGGCISTSRAVLKLTPVGVVRTAQNQKEECAPSSLVSSPPMAPDSASASAMPRP